MDNLRSCFRTAMYLWGRDQPPIEVEWYFTVPGAEVFPHPSPFRAVVWEKEDGYYPDDGLLLPPGAWRNGKPLVKMPGKHFHGSLAAAAGEAVWGVDPAFQTGPDGALDECRPPRVGDMEVHHTGQGGQLLRSRTRFRTGLAHTGAGGQAQGGTTPVLTGYAATGTGGQAQGGTTPVLTGYAATGTGGQAQGGLTPWVPGLHFVGSGGQAQGGTSAPVGGPPAEVIGGEFATGVPGLDTIVNTPAGTQEGDLLLAFVMVEGGGNNTDTPSGWSILQSSSAIGGSWGQAALYWLRATSIIPGSFTFTSSPAGTPSALIVTCRQVDDPDSWTVNQGDSGTGTFSGLTVAADHSLMLAFVANEPIAGNQTDPAGFSPITPATPFGPFGSWGAADFPAGASGDFTTDFGETVNWLTILLSLTRTLDPH